MKNTRDYAGLLLKKARQDLVLLNKLSDDLDVDDDIIGFHFQQVVEKSLKALLSLHGVAFRKTHDIRELLDCLTDNKVEVPSWFDGLDEWTPFAVEYRYGELPDGLVRPISRKDLVPTASAIISFVERQVS